MVDPSWFILAFDTETDGLLPPHHTRPPLHVARCGVDRPELFPRVLQVAWVVVNRKNAIVHYDHAYIRPLDSGAALHPAATRVHGITMERLMAQGEDGSDVWNRFRGDVCRAQLCVAHNAAFDIAMVQAECQRRSIPLCFSNVDQRRFACTMSIWQRKMGPRLRLASLFRTIHENAKEYVSTTRQDHVAHDALWDAECAARIAWRLCRMGYLRPPAQPLAPPIESTPCR